MLFLIILESDDERLCGKALHTLFCCAPVTVGRV